MVLKTEATPRAAPESCLYVPSYDLASSGRVFVFRELDAVRSDPGCDISLPLGVLGILSSVLAHWSMELNDDFESCENNARVAAGPSRALYLPGGLLDRNDVPDYLNGELPGDYGYDPLGLGADGNVEKYRENELLHARWAMLAAAGILIPEGLEANGAPIHGGTWFETGAEMLNGAFQLVRGCNKCARSADR